MIKFKITCIILIAIWINNHSFAQSNGISDLRGKVLYIWLDVDYNSQDLTEIAKHCNEGTDDDDLEAQDILQKLKEFRIEFKNTLMKRDFIKLDLQETHDELEREIKAIKGSNHRLSSELTQIKIGGVKKTIDGSIALIFSYGRKDKEFKIEAKPILFNKTAYPSAYIKHRYKKINDIDSPEKVERLVDKLGIKKKNRSEKKDKTEINFNLKDSPSHKYKEFNQYIEENLSNEQQKIIENLNNRIYQNSENISDEINQKIEIINDLLDISKKFNLEEGLHIYPVYQKLNYNTLNQVDLFLEKVKQEKIEGDIPSIQKYLPILKSISNYLMMPETATFFNTNEHYFRNKKRTPELIKLIEYYQELNK